MKPLALGLSLALAASAAAAQDIVPPEPAGAPLPLALNEAVQRALDASEEVGLARSQVDLARAQVRRAYSALYPQIDGALGYTRTVESSFDTGGTGPADSSTVFDPEPTAPRLAEGAARFFNGVLRDRESPHRLYSLGRLGTRPERGLGEAEAPLVALLALTRSEAESVKRFSNPYWLGSVVERLFRRDTKVAYPPQLLLQSYLDLSYGFRPDGYLDLGPRQVERLLGVFEEVGLFNGLSDEEIENGHRAAQGQDVYHYLDLLYPFEGSATYFD